MHEESMKQEYQNLRAEVETIYKGLDQNQVACIPLTRGLFALVDKRFEMRVNQYRWYANGSRPEHVYAVADVVGQRVSMQRLIRHFEADGSKLSEIKNVSFQNKCPLDCRSSNLLAKTDRQAMMQNRRRKRTSSSDYKGLKRIEKRSGGYNWLASIRTDEGDVGLGTHDDQRFAAEVYDAAAYVFFGASAHLNFPDVLPSHEAFQRAVLQYTKFRLKRSPPQ